MRHLGGEMMHRVCIFIKQWVGIEESGIKGHETSSENEVSEIYNEYENRTSNSN